MPNATAPTLPIKPRLSRFRHLLVVGLYSQKSLSTAVGLLLESPVPAYPMVGVAAEKACCLTPPPKSALRVHLLVAGLYSQKSFDNTSALSSTAPVPAYPLLPMLKDIAKYRFPPP